MRLSLLLAAGLVISPVRAQLAADQYYDPVEMAEARTKLKSGHGDQINTLVIGERVEYHSNDGEPLIVWEGQGWIGRDEHKLWLKTEGEVDINAGAFEEAELQALYSRAIKPFWDVQIGLRHDVKPTPSRSYFALGLQGLAPYWFEVDAALFLSDEGDVSTRVELEYEIRLTQRLILQPRIEINAAFSDDDELGIGAGLATGDFGLRLRYEIIREFAPYAGIAWSSAFGKTKKFRRAQNEETNQLSIVAGLRFWF